MTKRCSTCGEEKPLDEFNARYSCCKPCRREYARRYYLANRERIKAKSRAWYAKNPERAKANSERWRENNPWRYAEAKAIYLEKQKAERAARREERRQWEAANKDILDELAKQRQARKTAETTRRSREWRHKNPDKRKAQKMRHRGTSKAAPGAAYTTAEMVAARIAMFGGCCYYCGGPATEIDHRIPLSRGGSHWPANLVPACRVCNARKNAKTEQEFLAA